MNEVNCMSEEELRAHLKKMEKNKEELKFQEQRIWKEEEEEDEQIYAALVGLEHMREYAGENEKIILLIDEQKSILDNIRFSYCRMRLSFIILPGNYSESPSAYDKPGLVLSGCIV